MTGIKCLALPNQARRHKPARRFWRMPHEKVRIEAASDDVGVEGGNPRRAPLNTFVSCTEVIVKTLDDAKMPFKQRPARSLLGLTPRLWSAFTGDLKVTLILDEWQQSEKYSSVGFFQTSSVKAWIDAKNQNQSLIISHSTSGKNLPGKALSN